MAFLTRQLVEVYGEAIELAHSRSKLRRPSGRLFSCCLAGSFVVGKVFTYYTPTCEAFVLVLVGGASSEKSSNRRPACRSLGELLIEKSDNWRGQNQGSCV